MCVLFLNTIRPSEAAKYHFMVIRIMYSLWNDVIRHVPDGHVVSNSTSINIINFEFFQPEPRGIFDSRVNGRNGKFYSAK